MYQISNRQYAEVVEMLTAYVSTEKRGADLRTQKINTHIINNQNK